jgi:hypothetical protein
MAHEWAGNGTGEPRATRKRNDSFLRCTIVEEGAMANIIVIGGKVDDRFHAEINEYTADGYRPILMNSVVKDSARTKESEIHVTVLLEKS